MSRPHALIASRQEPPFAALVLASKVKNIKVIHKDNVASNLNIPSSKTKLNGDYIPRYLARLVDEETDSKTSKFYGQNAVEATEIDFFVALSAGLADKANLPAFAEQLNKHLLTRTFLVGSSASLADLMVFGQLHANKRFAGMVKQNAYPHLIRWFCFCQSLELFNVGLNSAIAAAADKVKKDAAKKEQSSGGSYNIGLPGATMGNVCTRFPPEPSGYLHIGHVKAALMNDYFARQYKGKLILRFDDTNPLKEKDEYVQSILKDLKTLDVQYHVLTHTSDHFELIQEKAVWMIKQGKAYMDDTLQQQMRDERMAGTDSKNRDNTVEENLRRFGELVKGSPEGLLNCLRAKIDMQAKNKTLRDPVMFRSNLKPHHRTGTKYKAYPTYDFACPIVDSLEGVTHALRTTEYHDRNAQFDWFLDAMSLRKVHIWDYSRLNFIYTLLSKRKLTWFVNEGLVDGWTDPRMPTVQGILRRGMTVNALRTFIRLQGASKSENLMEWDKIWAINKKEIDPVAERYTAIAADNAVEVTLSGYDAATPSKQMALLPKFPARGSKTVKLEASVFIEQDDAQNLKDGEEFTLMMWGNAIVTKITRSGDLVTGIEAKLNLSGSPKKTTKLTWIPGTDSKVGVKATLVEYDYLINKKKLEEGDSFENFLRPQTKFETTLLGEGALKRVRQGQHIQLNRRGFFICDKKADDGHLTLVLIPDGKQKKMSTLSSKVKKVQK